MAQTKLVFDEVKALAEDFDDKAVAYKEISTKLDEVAAHLRDAALKGRIGMAAYQAHLAKIEAHLQTVRATLSEMYGDLATTILEVYEEDITVSKKFHGG